MVTDITVVIFYVTAKQPFLFSDVNIVHSHNICMPYIYTHAHTNSNHSEHPCVIYLTMYGFFSV